jgi:hypothetical protein
MAATVRDKPTHEMVGKLQAWKVCRGIFKINDHKLFMFV